MTDSWVEIGRNPLLATDVDVDGVHTLKVTGVTSSTVALAAKAVDYPVLTTDSGGTFTNEGAAAIVKFTLPAASAGLTFTFIVQDADGIKVQAVGNDTIRLGDPIEVSAAAGYAQSTAVGATLTLVAINATEWFAISLNGSWTAV